MLKTILSLKNYNKWVDMQSKTEIQVHTFCFFIHNWSQSGEIAPSYLKFLRMEANTDCLNVIETIGLHKANNSMHTWTPKGLSCVHIL